MQVSNKAHIGSDLHRNDRRHNTVTTYMQPKSDEISYHDIGQPAKQDQHIVKASTRNGISPEVQDWLNRVVLPILKKVIFNV